MGYLKLLKFAQGILLWNLLTRCDAIGYNEDEGIILQKLGQSDLAVGDLDKSPQAYHSRKLVSLEAELHSERNNEALHGDELILEVIPYDRDNINFGKRALLFQSGDKTLAGLAKSATCQIDQLSFPFRTVIVRSNPQYKMLIHGQGKDKYISDSLSSGTLTYFERDLQIVMESKLPKDVPHENVVILDIGANIGLHSLYFASKGYEVHAFEPYPDNYNLLQCSKAANSFENLYLNNYGLSNSTSEGCMGLDTTNHGSAFVQKSRTDCESKIKLSTLDEYMDQYLQEKHPYLIKIDVEGHEFFALKGAQKLLTERTPKYIFSEVVPSKFHEVGMQAYDYFKYLADLGFTGYRILRQQAVTKVTVDSFPSEFEVGNSLFDIMFVHESAEDNIKI
eukprot:TRINITY_DN4351_c0_g1_i2.p1 TRINITY_DN4351_c0_g1~~TRINITY_DN4351_c0_g1_i2.p1  ORF type:complete len:443 (-),score=36.59 TRINITY_DN4351_c0_g1_i2:525-1703(-)